MLSLLLLACATSTPAPSTPVAAPSSAAAPAAPAAPQALGSLSEISVQQLHETLAGPDAITLIDVRTDPEYERGHIAGTVHISMETLMASTESLSEYAGQSIYVVCQSGGRSARVAQKISSEGFDAINVAGGTGAWQAAGYPVE